jgi:hypothetical protein
MKKDDQRIHQQTAANQQPYRSYLLRLWLVTGAGQGTWRASLENPQTGERLGFASLARLFAFLEDQTTTVVIRDGEPTESKTFH